MRLAMPGAGLGRAGGCVIRPCIPRSRWGTLARALVGLVVVGAGVRWRAVAQQDAVPCPKIKASAAILVEMDTGQVLYERNADTPRPPASTTKIMTAILLLEHLRGEEQIAASKRASETDGSSLNLKPGEKVSASDLLYALMLRSANDACVAVAERVAGSEAAFAEMMTRRAAELGATSTRFRNASGLNDPPNTTTARDLATLARYAATLPGFNEATRSRFRTIARSSDSKDVVLKNHAKFLWRFPGADGVKTGYTAPAGRCFVGSATWNGRRLLSVVLNSPDMYEETAALLRYGFRSFERRSLAAPGSELGRVPVRGGEAADVAVGPTAPVVATTHRNDRAQPRLSLVTEPLEAPVTPGQRAGTLQVWLGERLAFSTPVVVLAAVPRATPALAATPAMPMLLYLLVALITGGIAYAAATATGARGGGDRLKAFIRDYYQRG